MWQSTWISKNHPKETERNSVTSQQSKHPKQKLKQSRKNQQRIGKPHKFWNGILADVEFDKNKIKTPQKHLTKPSRTSRNLKNNLDSMHSRLAQKCQKQLNTNRKHLLYYCVNYWLEPEFGHNISKQNTSKKHIANLFMLHSFCQWRSFHLTSCSFHFLCMVLS